MRFHRLEMTAFGPYADTQVVDFEELNDAGLFLLTGPTGAGKTSILDALCFALYGVVPGERGVRTLRSHHADPAVRPAVELEVTLGERRFRICRSPEWRRPKKRGDGETTEPAAASLVELDGAQERLVSSRVQEVGHELSLVLGMSAEQFLQVVLLPQGEFQTFLRATSDERQAVLQRLFRTGRFARVEEWVRQRSQSLHAQAERGQRAVTELLATLAHRAGLEELPENLADPASPTFVACVRAWSGELLAQCEQAEARSEHADEVALAALRQAEQQHARAERSAAAARQRATARTSLAALEETEPEAALLRDRWEAHARAERLTTVLGAVRRADQRCHEARERHSRAAAALEGCGPWRPSYSHDDVAVATAAADVRSQLDRARAGLPRAHALADAQARRDAVRARLPRLEEQLEACVARQAQHPDRAAQARGALADARTLADRREPALQALRAAEVTAVAASRLPEARAVEEQARARHLEARDQAADARERHLALVERRLAGMAAELASTLVDGTPCVVCGSLTHPEPAAAERPPVSEHDLRRAQDEVDRLRQAADEQAEQLRLAQERLTRLEVETAGQSAEDAAAQLAECRREVDAARRARETLERLEREVESLDAEGRALDDAVMTAREAVGQALQELAAEEATVEALTDEVHAASSGSDLPLTELVARLERVDALLDEAVESTRALREAAAHLDSERTHAATAAHQQGFPDLDAVAAALLSDEEARAAATTLEDRRTRAAAARATLDDPDLAALAALAESGQSDPLEAEAAVEAARADARATATERGSSAETAAAVRGLAERLEAALVAWEPARAEHAVAEGMSKLVRGMGADNQLQMRLSSYVLATRLDQVLDAANERLAQMRDHRYALRRSAEIRSGRRAGLGLEVLDGWTGEARAPTTLSGGETFVVSLALALGLADVVTQEAGGLHVGTLFVDEGFGMLDPDTLDDVMDRIDALRSGGRTVGVVSHVSELRARIPTQVHVTRSRTGSQIAVRTLTA